MQSLVYIWRNVSRNKLRSILTILSVGFSLALLTVLYGYMAMQSEWGKEAEKYNRIVVMNSQGFSGLLPIAYVDRVRQIPGVQGAVPYAWYGGNYKEEQMPFAQFATDPDNVLKVWDEFTIDPQQLAAWQDNRTGCIADRRLVEKRGWKIGEHIPLKGTFYPFNLDLTLVGTFDSPKNTDSLWFHWQYLDEGLRQMNAPGSGNAGTIFAKVESAQSMPGIIKAIDERFGSSENPTRTQSEAAFAQMFADMLGNIQVFMLMIGGAVVLSLTLVAGSALAMSMRERTTEIAVLKAIGFSGQRVLLSVLGEACVITLLGGIVGIGIGCLTLEAMHLISSQFFPFSVLEMMGAWVVYLLLLSAGIGLASGILPAFRASQLSVIDGLRRVV